MCNLYAQTTAQDAMRQVFHGVLGDDVDLIDSAGNLPALPAIWPDDSAPIIRHAAMGGGLELARARWGMPTPPPFLVGKRRDPGVTNIRNLNSYHWQRWLGVAHRCLVPFSSFAEPDSRPGPTRGRPVWFALGPDRPLGFFAGIRTEWTSVRKVKEGAVTVDAFGFLTCEASADIAPIHPKAMPVVLTRPQEWRLWLTAPFERARALQRPLAAGRLQIVSEGAHEDPA